MWTGALNDVQQPTSRAVFKERYLCARQETTTSKNNSSPHEPKRNSGPGPPSHGAIKTTPDLPPLHSHWQWQWHQLQ